VTAGTFKVPGLRNLELTAPYFHNGGQRIIRQVVEFYNRGGDFREHNVLNTDFEIGKLNLTDQQIDDLVAFLGRPLTRSACCPTERTVRSSTVVRAERRQHERTPSMRDR
jgi:cytochrome c peroxidase